MNLIRLCVERPVAVASMVILVVMMGLVALKAIPVQLIPEVNKPVVTVTTLWYGAAPEEVEREIINRQEEVLKGLEGLERMLSRSEDGRGHITLEFGFGQDLSRALLLVANRLDRVKDYPNEVDRPTLRTSSSEDNPIAWIVLRRKPGNTQPIDTYGDLIDDLIADRLQRVPGVSQVNLFGGAEREIRVTMDPERMARYGLTVSEVVATLRAANAIGSAGDVEEGKRRYVVRADGELTSPGAVREVVLRAFLDPRTGRTARVRVADIATVDFEYKKPDARIRMLGEAALAVNVVRESGANVLEVMEGVREVIKELNESTLPGLGVYLAQVYDETVYIDSSLDLVTQNIYVGGVLAALVLLAFLRSGRATLIIALAIPVSIIGSFVAMTALGRTINVISLAGIAFAVGMVVDAAIVVLENIYRLREEGLSRKEAAIRGTGQVWGAILASALTTVVAFVPLLILKLEAGQLFRDIAVALSVAVLLSLVVAITVIPTLANRLAHADRAPVRSTDDAGRESIGGKVAPLARRIRGARAAARMTAPFDRFAVLFVESAVGLARYVIAGRMRSIILVGAICGGTAAATWLFLPKLDYLPDGNRNLVIGIIQPPPGYNLDTTTGIARAMEHRIAHLWPEPARTAFLESQKGAGGSEPPADPAASDSPKIQRFFFVARRAMTIIGAAAEDPRRIGDLIPALKDAAFREPGTFGIVSQRSLFAGALSGGRQIDLDISGPDLPALLEVAIKAVAHIESAMPRSQGTQIRPRPGLELGSPEIRVIPDRIKLADSGVTARELTDSLAAFNNGLRVAEVTVSSRRMDLTLQGPVGNVAETQGVGYLPVVTASGKIVPVASLGEVTMTAGPSEIRHLERARTVTLEVRPNETVPLEVAIDTIRREVIQRLETEGLPRGVVLSMSGTADKLAETWNAMVWNIVLALAVVYLVMAVLYESFVYPLIIMFSVPLATAGGVLGLVTLNLFTFQALDMLTLLGFVILVGTVVNNAILLVHQTLNHIRDEGMAPRDAILAATRNRIRPIFMSTLTSVAGMLPLVIFPGAGSELYRGIGSVVVGGLALSAVLTLAIIPPLMSLVTGTLESRRHRRQVERATRKAAE